jgi:hypothetical protein
MANPLTATDKKEIEAHLKAAEKIRSDINRARMAGLDVTEQEATLNAAVTQLQKIKAAYFSTGE